MKRVIDALLAAVLLVLALPVVVVSLIGSALSLLAWPIFTQTRIGLHGRPFTFVKIRTLPPSTPRYTDKYALQGVRKARFPAMLRRTHLDELPQLVLVVFGRMSLVGPRPEMPFLHRSLPGAFATERVSVRPGCTGLWQISDRNDALIGEAPEFDRYYVNNQSLRLDLWVLARTAKQVLAASSKRVSFEELPPAEAAPGPTSVAVAPAVDDAPSRRYSTT